MITTIIIKTIHKSAVGKGKQLGETEFPRRNCSSELKDSTFKNRISKIYNYTLCKQQKTRGTTKRI